MSQLVAYPGEGCIVEYMEGNAPQLALIIEAQNGKLRLLLPNRRETRLGVARLLPWAGPQVGQLGKDAAVQELERRRVARETRAAAVDPLELWEMAQGEVPQATAQWFAELCEDAPDVDAIAAYGRALLQCKSHFKFQPPSFEVYDAATVERRMAEQEAARQREALVAGGAGFLRLLWEVHTKKRTLPPPGSREYPPGDIQERLRGMLLTRIADPETHEDDLLWNTLTKGLPDVPHVPLLLAMAWGLVPPHYNFWLARADYAPGDNWHEPLAADVAALVEKARQGASPVDGYELPELPLPFISIDGASTRDVDDAFHVRPLPDGGMELTLALACPALYWDFGSPLDKLVSRRATSLYLPEGTYHMLPEALGTGAFPLSAGLWRPAFCVECVVAADGSVISCAPRVCRVRLAANLHFEDCEALLDPTAFDALGEENPARPHVEQLRLGLQLAEVRQALRIAAGAVIMDRPDPKIVLEGEGADTIVRLTETPPTPLAQKLVAEMMILASAAMAQWGRGRGLPLIYRSQDVALPREYAGVWTAPHDMARIIRALAPSQMECQPHAHAGLGVRAYSPVTSPLRRYPDLLNEAQFVHFLLTGTPRFDGEHLERVRQQVSQCLESVGQVQRFRPRYWKLVYVRQQGDRVWWDGVITEENDSFCSVALPREQLFVRGRRSMFGERACPGQPVQVRLGKVNPLYNEISLLEVTDI